MGKNGPERGLKAVALNPYFHVIKENNADPDQTPHFAMSDQRLHCLPMSEMSKSKFYK